MDNDPWQAIMDDILESRWGDFLGYLRHYRGKRFNFGALFRDCQIRRIEGDKLVLIFSHASHLERMEKELQDFEGRMFMQEAIYKALGGDYKLELSKVSDHDHLARAALGMGGRFLKEDELERIKREIVDDRERNEQNRREAQSRIHKLYMGSCITVLASRFDVSSSQGKAQAAEVIFPIIAAMDDGFSKDMCFRKLKYLLFEK